MTNQVIKITNPKEHFILNDSLDNVTYDVDFSIFKKYMCRAGCKICYIQNDWLPEDKFEKYIPIRNGKTHTERLLNFFSYFDVVSTIDDLRFIKEEHPSLFQFYQEYGQLFHLSSMSDNAIMRHLPIVQNEIAVKGIREISISEYFLNRVNVTKLLHTLDIMQSKAKIMKIKVILAPQNDDPKRAMALIDWCQTNAIDLEKQFEHGIDIGQTTSILTKLKNSSFSESSDFTESQTYSENTEEIFPFHSELLFLMYDEFYSELKSATAEGRSDPFASLSDFDDPIGFLAKVLESKIVDYRRYMTMINNKNTTHYKYFDFVVNHLLINKDFNFIPKVAFKSYSTYYRRIVESGKMIDTPYGLVKPDVSTIIPIYTFKEHEPFTI